MDIDGVLGTGLDIIAGLLDKIAKSGLGRLDSSDLLDIFEELVLLDFVDRGGVSVLSGVSLTWILSAS